VITYNCIFFFFLSFLSQDFPSWKRESFPVVDGIEKCIGFDLLMLQNNLNTFNEFPTNDKQDGSGKDSLKEEYRRKKQEKNYENQIHQNYFGLVVQQSGTGDIYAQKVSWSSSRYSRLDPISRGNNVNEEENLYFKEAKGRDFSQMSESEMTSTTAQFDTETDTNSVLNTSNEKEKETEEEEDGEHNFRKPSVPRFKKEQTLITRSRPKKGRKVVQLAPLNIFSTIGNRSFAATSTLLSAKDVLLSLSRSSPLLKPKNVKLLQLFLQSTIYHSFQNIKKYLKTIEEIKNQKFPLTRKTGGGKMKRKQQEEHQQILLGLQLTLQSFNESDIIKDNLFPLSSFFFLVYLPEDCVSSYDYLQFHVLDIRRDFPPLPELPHLTFLKPPLYKMIVNNQNDIIYEIFVKYEKEIIQFFSFTLNKSSSSSNILFPQQQTNCRKTLYEIWKQIYQLSKYRIKINHLRHCLLHYHEFISVTASSPFMTAAPAFTPNYQFHESFLPSRLDFPVKYQNSYYSDGLYMQKDQNDDDDKDHDDEDHESGNESIVVKSEGQMNGNEVPLKKKIKRNNSNEEPPLLMNDSTDDSDDDDDDDFLPTSGRYSSNQSTARKPQSLDEKYYGCADHKIKSLNELGNWDCMKRDCIIPHRLCYTVQPKDELNSISTLKTPLIKSKATPTTSSISDFLKAPQLFSSPEGTSGEEDDGSGFLRTKERTDVTGDLIELLQERWDRTMGSAFPVWSNRVTIDITK
jgi:hypothetical protein